jgi:TonB-dependent starch-binding outer membrane protein SusC
MTRIFTTPGKCMLLFFACFCLNATYAQEKQVTGTVTSSENKLGAAGVTVRVKGTRTAATTDAQGRYRIMVRDNNATLVFTSTSLLTIETAVGDKTVVDIEMQPDVRSLTDVVVIGYQTIRRKDLLASVSSVSARDLKDIPINSAAEALNGRLAGVTATTAEGSPDANIRVRVRGGMSISQDNDPLYVVDGVQVEKGLSFISPQDIESIDVLKDAAATAIYGARGANGVVVITTKSGRPGKLKVSYNGFVGVRVLAKKLKVLDPYDYVVYQYERSRRSSTDSVTFDNSFGHVFDSLSVYKNAEVIDWQKEVFGNTGFTQTHNISASGGTRLFTYMFGYTFNDEKAVVINSEFKRHLLNFKGDYNITKGIKLGAGVRYTNQDVLGAGTSDEKGSSYNRLRNAVKYRPFLSEGMDIDDADPFADPNVGNGLNLYNPITLANSEYRKKSTEVFNVTGNLNINITKNLSFRSTVGYDHNKRIDRQFSDSLTPYSAIQGGRKPIVGLDTITAKTLTNSNVLTYSVANYKNKHDFTVLLGEETYDIRTENRLNLFRDYPTFTPFTTAFKETSLGVPVTGYPKLAKTRYTNLSFFGRINYSFLDKYLFSFNMRADGASKFAPGKQWGYFPGGSFAWRVKNEKIMQNVTAISDLKFRVGFGEIGNNRIPDYLFLTFFRNDGAYYYGINNEPITAFYPGTLPNPNLKWESTVNRNFGVDVSILRRFDLSIDYYSNTSKDLLLLVPIASTYGYSTQIQNVGKTSNKGIEFQLNAGVMKKSNFTWNINFNISSNKNKIVELANNQDFTFTPSPWGVSGQPADYIQMIGKPVGSMWGYVTDGFYTLDDFTYSNGLYTLKPGVANNSAVIGVAQPGAIKFKDLNGDTLVTNDDRDRTIIGDPTPKFTGGLNQQFTFKQWDLSLFVNFSYGNDIYNANKIEFTNGYANNANMLETMGRRWRTITPTGETSQWLVANPIAGQPPLVYGLPPDQIAAINANANIWQPIRTSGAFYPHSWAIEDGSFLRFNNLTIGYTLPASSLGKLKMSKLRFYFTANNLAIITSYSGYDPEVNVRANNPQTPGLDYSAYPKSRSFIFGVNATF